MQSRLMFCSGAGTVTGANFLLDTGTQKFLVDCGALEESHVCDTVNAAPFPYDPKSIDVLFVTHAHQDHVGRIPKLVRDGFSGRIISTAATKDLAAVMLEDALGIMEDHAERFDCGIIYERADLERALTLWEGTEYHRTLSFDDINVEFADAGHILGSAIIRFSRGGRSIAFTGDLGNVPEPLLRPIEPPVDAEYVVMESVYGDRLHDGLADRRERFLAIIADAAKRGGTLLIPSFSLERTQVLLYELHTAREHGAPAIPVFLDSPLATRVTEIFRAYRSLMNEDARHHFESDDPFSFPGLTVVKTPAESMAIHKERNPKIIIAGAGMSAGGRIRSHEKEYLEDKRTTVLFVGYQAPGTLGRRIQDGERSITLDGAKLHIRAHVESLQGYSGHADRDQLLSFLETLAPSLTSAFIVMGEPKASQFLAQRAHDHLDIHAIVPQQGQTVTIDL